ncbi:MAG: glycosyltransferase family 8 protein [Treponema sp.]|nr:glycosyltransferase family 8 protein [Treponema sp.]
MSLHAKKQEIPIFFAIDDNYAPFFAVALTSLLDNASKNFFYKIYVLTTSLRKEYADRLRLIVDDLAVDNASIDFVSMKDEMEKSTGTFHLRHYYSKETYCRIFIPRVFKQYDKVLYLDSDIVVTGDISELYNTDLGDNLVAAASEEVMTDYDVFGSYVENVLGVWRYDYFSAGVLLINAKLYREENIEMKFIDLLNSFTFRVTQDEDYLNVLCKGRVKPVSLGWNKSSYKSKTNKDFDDKDLRLIHYKINWKPWHYDEILYEDYFWKYAKETFLYDKILKIKAGYGADLRERDTVQFNELVKMAEEDTVDPNNYWATQQRKSGEKLVKRGLYGGKSE